MVKANNIVSKAKLLQGWAGRDISPNHPGKRSLKYPHIPSLVGDKERPAVGKAWDCGIKSTGLEKAAPRHSK